MSVVRRKFVHLTEGELGLLALLSVVLVHYAELPLWHTDLWDHVNYGRWMLEYGRLPETEPLVPLADQQPMTHTAWLSQVIMAAVMGRNHGELLLQWLHAALITAAAAVPAIAVYRRRNSAIGGLATVLVMIALCWHQNQVVRPQTAGVLFFCVLVGRMVHKPARTSIRSLLLLAVMFACWANLHGSFAIGLAVMGLTGAGRALQIGWQRRSWAALLSSAATRATLQRLVVGGLASCVNPHGIDIYPVVLSVGQHPNIPSMLEWQPLSWWSDQGRTLAVVAVLLLLTFAFSPKAKRWGELLPLLFFAALTLYSSRMINWLGPVAAVAAGQHLSALIRRRRIGPADLSPAPRRCWRHSAVGAILVVAIAATQAERLTDRTSERTLSHQTPVRAAEQLQQLQPRGLCFAPAEWAGFLQNRTPNFRPMVNLHVHLMPPELWADYLQLASGRTNFDTLLSRYDFNYIIVNRYRNGPLSDWLRSSSRWRQIHVDRQARIFQATGP